MERNGDDGLVGGIHPQSHAEFDGQPSALTSTFFLDHVGQVVLTFNSDGLSWNSVDSFTNVVSSSSILSSSFFRCLVL